MTEAPAPAPAAAPPEPVEIALKRGETLETALRRTGLERGGARPRSWPRCAAASTCDASPPASGSASSRGSRRQAHRDQLRPLPRRALRDPPGPRRATGRSPRCGPTWTRAWWRSPASSGTRSSRAWSGSARRAGLTARLVNLFEWDFDFAADSLPGDRFRLLVEKRYVGDAFLGYGDVLVAQYASVGRSLLTSVAFGDTAGRREYYDASGRSVKKMFLRAPLDFTRVTSGFSHARFHPVLGGLPAAPRGGLRGADRHAGAGGGRRGGHPRGLERRLRDLHLAAPRARLRDHVQPPLQDRRPPGRAGAPAPGHRPGRQHRAVHRPAPRLPRAQGRGPGQPAGREVHPRLARARPPPRGVHGARRRPPGAARRPGSAPRAIHRARS